MSWRVRVDHRSRRSPAGRDAFAVTPVVDYEPPPQDVPPNRTVPPCRPSSHAPARRRNPHAPHRPHLRQPDSQPAAPPARPATSCQRRCGRRPSSPTPRCAGCWKSSTVAVPPPSCGPCSRRPWWIPWWRWAARRPGRQGAAVVRRMRLQPAGHRDPDTAAEVFGCYSRGDRIHAIACRVERFRWRCNPVAGGGPAHRLAGGSGADLRPGRLGRWPDLGLRTEPNRRRHAGA